MPRSKLRWPGGPTQFTSVIPRAYRLEPLGTDAPTPAAQHRYDVVRWYEEHGRGVRLAARHFGHSPDTVSRWVRALDRRGMRGLEDKSRRPKQVRRPTTQLDQVRRIRELPEQYPRWAARSCASCCCARASLSRQDHRPDHPRAFGRGGSCTSPRRCAKPCGHRPARPCVPAGHRPWSPTAWPSCSYAVPQNARHLRTDLQAAALQSEFVNEPVGTDTSRTTVARGPSTRCRNP